MTDTFAVIGWIVVIGGAALAMLGLLLIFGNLTLAVWDWWTKRKRRKSNVYTLPTKRMR